MDLIVCSIFFILFREESSLSGVAQAVVDQVVRLHHDRLEASGGRADTREDITLLIREFGGCREPRGNTPGRGLSRGLMDKKEEKTLTRSSARYIRILFIQNHSIDRLLKKYNHKYTLHRNTFIL